MCVYARGHRFLFQRVSAKVHVVLYRDRYVDVPPTGVNVYILLYFFGHLLTEISVADGQEKVCTRWATCLFCVPKLLLQQEKAACLLYVLLLTT